MVVNLTILVRHLTNNVGMDVVSAGDGQAGCVSAISVENYEVWTQLNNGLFAWRIRKTGRMNNRSKNILGEQGPSSASRNKIERNQITLT